MNKKLRKCNNCRGTGKVGDQTCCLCGGHGKYFSNPNCHQCKGVGFWKGKIYRYFCCLVPIKNLHPISEDKKVLVKCLICGGDGVAEERKCWACKGFGKFYTNKDCNYCHGGGFCYSFHDTICESMEGCDCREFLDGTNAYEDRLID